jgi:hypothetical protein
VSCVPCQWIPTLTFYLGLLCVFFKFIIVVD